MIVNRSVAVGLGLAAGTVAGVVLYASASASPTPGAQDRQVARVVSDIRATYPAPTLSYAPCAPPAVLEKGTCVTHVVVTTVVAGPVEQQPQRVGSRSGELGEVGEHEGQEHDGGEDD